MSSAQYVVSSAHSAAITAPFSSEFCAMYDDFDLLYIIHNVVIKVFRNRTSKVYNLWDFNFKATWFCGDCGDQKTSKAIRKGTIDSVPVRVSLETCFWKQSVGCEQGDDASSGKANPRTKNMFWDRRRVWREDRPSSPAASLSDSARRQEITNPIRRASSPQRDSV